jgi:hypothetical protein
MIQQINTPLTIASVHNKKHLLLSSFFISFLFVFLILFRWVIQFFQYSPGLHFVYEYGSFLALCMQVSVLVVSTVFAIAIFRKRKQYKGRYVVLVSLLFSLFPAIYFSLLLLLLTYVR